MKQLLFIFIGGGSGSIARYLLSKIGNVPHLSVPLGTLAVNIIGSFILGLILGWALKYDSLQTNTTLLLATGFCGGFTTFSTFAYENHALLKSGDYVLFGSYIIGSIVLGIIAIFAGVWLGDKIL